MFRRVPVVGSIGQEWTTVTEILELPEYIARDIEGGQQQYTPLPAQLPGGFHSSYDATRSIVETNSERFVSTCCFELVPLESSADTKRAAKKVLRSKL